MARIAVVLFVLGVFAVTAYAADSGSTRTSCFIRGASVDRSHYDPVARVARVHMSVKVEKPLHCADSEGIVSAEGRGFPPSDVTNQAQAEILALEAAKVLAYKAIAQCLCGTIVK